VTDSLVVLITAATEDEAAAIAKALVDGRLAACVNIVKQIRSIYRWQGKVEDEQEVLMIAKTRKELFADLVHKVKELHSYSVPEIIALPIFDGFGGYLDWLRAETVKDSI
jgi:periplasmic divalent cation tolerance protein